jgi:hypothetical protein
MRGDIPISIGYLLFTYVELKSDRVDAIALAGRLRAVVEDVAQVGVAAAADHFDPTHPVA